MSKYEFDKDLIYKRELKNGTWVKTTIEELEEIALDTPNSLPSSMGNYTNLNNYMLKYWRKILGSSPSNVLITLLMRCYGDSESTFPSIPTIADESGIGESATKDSLKKLIKYDWIEKIQVVRPDGKNKNNIYFVRRLTPYVPVEEYLKFSPRMKKSHDKFLADLIKKKFIAIGDFPDYESAVDNSVDKPVDENEENVDKGMGSDFNPTEEMGSDFNPIKNEGDDGVGFQPLSKFNPSGGENQPQWGRNPTTNNYSFKNYSFENLKKIYNKYGKQFSVHDVNNLFHEKAEQRMSKPSYETWIKESKIADIEDGIAYILTANDFVKDWLQHQYKHLIVEILDEMNIDCTDITVYVID